MSLTVTHKPTYQDQTIFNDLSSRRQANNRIFNIAWPIILLLMNAPSTQAIMPGVKKEVDETLAFGALLVVVISSLYLLVKLSVK